MGRRQAASLRRSRPGGGAGDGARDLGRVITPASQALVSSLCLSVSVSKLCPCSNCPILPYPFLCFCPQFNSRLFCHPLPPRMCCAGRPSVSLPSPRGTGRSQTGIDKSRYAEPAGHGFRFWAAVSCRPRGLINRSVFCAVPESFPGAQ